MLEVAAMKDRCHIFLLAGMALSAILAFALGHFRPQVVPDTGGYFFSFVFPDIFSQRRTPFYALFVAILGGESSGFALVPAAQAAILGFATLVFYRAVRAWHDDGLPALALTLPLLFGNPVLLYLNSIHPEILAIACVLLALAALVRLSDGASWRWQLMFGGSLGFGYLLKPAFVFFIPVLPVLYFLLLRLRGRSGIGASLRRAALLAVVGAVPFVGYAGLRAATVGDFNIVSFGGFNSSGMSGLMLTTDTPPKLRPEHRDLAKVILAERERLAAEGAMLPIPRNSEGVRSFISTAVGYFDILARSYDNVSYEIVLPRKGEDENWVAFNRRLQAFTVDVIKAELRNYLAWIIGAGTRIVGLMTITNMAFMLVCGILVLVLLIPVMRASVGMTYIDSRALTFLVLVVGAYILANCLPMMLLAFPARRYVETAGLLLPALPLFVLLRMVRRL
jgi:hypothetical protein